MIKNLVLIKPLIARKGIIVYYKDNEEEFYFYCNKNSNKVLSFTLSELYLYALCDEGQISKNIVFDEDEKINFSYRCWKIVELVVAIDI